MGDGKIIGKLWWCEDEICDCYQPQIERVTPDASQLGGYKREQLWTGTFISQPTTDEHEALRAELREACERYDAENLDATRSP